MKTEQVQVYEFKELSKEIQGKVLDKMRDINIDYDWWDSDLEGFKERLEEIGLSCETFYFDIYDREFYMHKPRIEDLRKFLMSALISNDAEKLLMKIEDNTEFEKAIQDLLDSETDFGIEENRNYNSVYGLEDIGEKLGIDYDEYLKGILKGFLNELSEQEDYLQTDESIIETITINDYQFLEDGERW